MAIAYISSFIFKGEIAYIAVSSANPDIGELDMEQALPDVYLSLLANEHLVGYTLNQKLTREQRLLAHQFAQGRRHSECGSMWLTIDYRYRSRKK